jgi:hypothetical protein
MPRLACLALALAVAVPLALAGCKTGANELQPEPKPAPSPVAAPAPSPSPAPATPEGALRLGAPIEASAQKIALSELAKNPSAFVGKKFATTGTVTSVCQHMGCWMEIKDDSGEAHIKMAGHAFFVPKTASGRKARVLATLVKDEGEGACADEGMAAAGEAPKKGCRAEAEAQLGRPLAKLELLAEGVELM